ncbi:MAG: ribonuclease III family protein [Promethearchaeota archaeon]
MDFKSLLKDINSYKFRKIIGTDKGLAKIGDGLVNLSYSVAKSLYLTKNSTENNSIRTGLKVSKTILANALKNADMKSFAKNRADAHDLADTVEAIIAYIWLNKNMTVSEIIEFITNNLNGDLTIRNEEIKCATIAFEKLLKHIKQFLPEK